MRNISVSMKGKTWKRNGFENFCVGAGRANEGLRFDFYTQLKTCARECGFRYLRFHGLLHDDMGVLYRDQKGTIRYNFQYIDTLFDQMLECGVKPFVELGFMPKAIASGDKTVFWWRANVTHPADYDKWYDLIYELTAHLTRRYGEDEVGTWFFEVWNEPDYPAFFDGDRDEYFKLYNYTARAVKAVNEKYPVGGPATSSNRWVPEFISYCDENNLPCDFISTHTYGVEGALDEYGQNMQVLISDPDDIPKCVRRVREQIDFSSRPGLPLYYTEWSASYSSRDNIHDSYVSAPYILYNLKRSSGAAAGMSYWTFTDVFEEGGPGPAPFHGGFGLVNMQGIKKPAYYAYEFLNALGSEELENGDADSVVCRSGAGVQALFWDYTKPDQGKIPNQLYFVRDLKPEAADTVSLEVDGMEPGAYLLKVRRVGYRERDAYEGYLDMGRPEELSREQADALKKISEGETCREIVRIEGKFTKEFPMTRNEAVLAELKKM